MQMQQTAPTVPPRSQWGAAGRARAAAAAAAAGGGEGGGGIPCLANISLATSAGRGGGRAADGSDGADPIRRRRSGHGQSTGGADGESGPGTRGGVRFVGAGASGGGEDEEDEAVEASSRPILISSIDFDGSTPELEQLARRVVSMKPNFSYTIEDITADVTRIFNTGFFNNVMPETVDTRDGVSLTFRLQANEVIRGYVIDGANELPVSEITETFRPQCGKVLSSIALVTALGSLGDWYKDNSMPAEIHGVDVRDGVVMMNTNEPRIGTVEIRFLDQAGETTTGHTRPEYIHRHLKSIKTGKAMHGRMVDDITDLLGTAGYEDVNLSFNHRRVDGGGAVVDTIVNVTERPSTNFSGGGGISAKGLQDGGLSALIANADYNRRNLFGKSQTLNARVEISPSSNLGTKPEVDIRLAHLDPWVGDAHRTSRRTFLDSDSSSLESIHARAESVGDDDADLGAADDGPRSVFVRRIISGVEYRRPLAACWTGTLAATWQRASTHDDLKRPCPQDAYGSPLTFSGLGHDTMANALMRFVYNRDGRNEAQLVVSAEQALPLRPDMLSFNRLNVRAQRSVHVAGARLTVAAKGGNIVGDLPPYEAFPIGGANSVRGYAEGGVGTGRKFIVGSAELSVPLVPDVLNGCVFFDIGSDLKSGVSVLGDPGGTRGKPGQGYGYGLGVSAMTPIGPLRLEYAFSDKGVGRMHCGMARNF
jgi:outer membrane protein insertion porin family